MRESLGKAQSSAIKALHGRANGGAGVVLLADGTTALFDPIGGNLRRTVVTDATTRSLRMGPIAAVTSPERTSVDLFRLVDMQTVLRLIGS